MVFGSTILEVAIGIVFVYLLLSLICTAASEFISRIFAMRSNNLAEGIQNLLNEPGTEDIAKKLYEHPLIAGLSKEGVIDKKLNWLARKLKLNEKLCWGGPSYIPPRMFVIALLDIVAPKDASKFKSLESLRFAVDKSGNINYTVRTALLALIDSSNGKLEDAEKNIEDWFNGTMGRVSGWYKRNIQTIILILALVIVVVANVDSVMLANNFAQDSTLRASLVTSAEEFTGRPVPTSNISINDTEYAIEQLRMMPIGWTNEPCNLYSLTCGTSLPDGEYRNWLLKKIFGLLVTVFALSLGAPFWFDVLNRFVNLRATGKSPESKQILKI